MTEIFKFNLNTIQQFLYIAQNIIISFTIGFYLGHYIDHIFPRYNEIEDLNNFKLTIEILGQIILLTIISHYLKHILRKIPFLFKFSNNFVALPKNNLIGIDMGLGLVYISNQTNMLEKIKELRNNIFNLSE